MCHSTTGTGGIPANTVIIATIRQLSIHVDEE